MLPELSVSSCFSVYVFKFALAESTFLNSDEKEAHQSFGATVPCVCAWKHRR